MLKIPELGMSEKEFRKVAKEISKLMQIDSVSTGFAVMRFDTMGNNMIVQNVCGGDPENIINALRVTANQLEEIHNGAEPPPMH